MTPAAMEVITASSSDGTVVRLEVHGFVDYDCADHFLALVSRPLEASPGLRALHLDCKHLDGLDSMGLAMVLMLHRRTTAAGVTLYLDQRSPALERLLDITGTLEYLVPGSKDTPSTSTESQAMAYRLTSDSAPAADRSGRPGGPEMTS
ncbi:STAS domain-containing protein [Streptomyces sp. NPDC127574]|uniref:STAS domain-containing protein n=1 Tax=Streptomyces sp. NPDC127574 TaxID=3345401 RepID=UPI0036458BA8